MPKPLTPAQTLAHKRKLKAEQMARYRIGRRKTRVDFSMTIAQAKALQDAIRGPSCTDELLAAVYYKLDSALTSN